jgi:spore germination cell wall hydrolase CwlJ-like protein
MISTTLKWVALAVLSTLPVVMLGSAAGISWQSLNRLVPSSTSRLANGGLPALPAPELQLVKPLTAQEAIAANGAVPFASNAVEQANSFAAAASLSDPLAYKAALDCLTAAVYYEAAGEGEGGQRAVAQVVLNRVRHPAFPARVCDVVYQGSERRTGCQFTFTCDGSLARRPNRAGWDRARKVAGEALAGAVDAAVGMATHYHANWVVPYWAPGLDKIAAVGAHIFYRWPGYWGRRQAFTQRYAGETLTEMADLAGAGQAADPAVEDPLQLIPRQQLSADLLGRLPAVAALPPTADGAARELIVDQAAGGLVVDERNFRLDRDTALEPPS